MRNTANSSVSMDRSIQRWGIAGACGLCGVIVAFTLILCATSYKRRRKLSEERSNLHTLSKQRSSETPGIRISQLTSRGGQAQEYVTSLSETREPNAGRSRYASPNSGMPDKRGLLTSSKKSMFESGNGNRRLSSHRTAKVSSSENQVTGVHVQSNKPRRVHSQKDTKGLSLAPERFPMQPLRIPRARLSLAPPQKDRNAEMTSCNL